jgi:ribosome-binding protein aMBF1 (putative translation factor)
MRTLEDHRRRRGWSRAELGRRARVDPSWLAKVEGGRVRPYPVQLRRLARALGWPSRDGAGLLDETTPAADAGPPAA